MSQIPFLHEYARRLTGALKIIHTHLDDLCASLSVQCPRASVRQLAAMVCDQVFDGVFAQ